MSETSRTPASGASRKEAAEGPVDWPTALAEHQRWLRLAVFARLRDEPEAVEEVMQEVAVATLSSRRVPSAIGNVGAWLYRLAVRQALLYRRRQGRGRRLFSRHLERGGAESEASSEIDPLSWLIKTERDQLVREALVRLPPRDAEILLLKYGESWNARRISERFGVSVSAVEARLHRARARLRPELAESGVVEGHGVVVSSLEGGGPADLAGLKLHDILLQLDEKAIRSPDDLTKLLKEAGEKEVPLELMRAGRLETIKVKPVYRVTLAPAAPQNPRSYIGLTGGELDETLRSQLRLPADRGFLVNTVVKDGPAAKADLKERDIILAFNGQPVRSVQELSALVQANEAGRAVELEIQRGQESRVIAVMPEPWKQRPDDKQGAEAAREWDHKYVLGTVPVTGTIRRGATAGTPIRVDAFPIRGAGSEYRMAMPSSGVEPALVQQLGGLQKQVKELKAMVEELRNQQKPATPDVPAAPNPE